MRDEREVDARSIRDFAAEMQASQGDDLGPMIWRDVQRLAESHIEREALFSVGDRVVVRYMGDYVGATVVEVAGHGYLGRKLKVTRYRLALPGVSPLAWYEEHEVRAE